MLIAISGTPVAIAITVKPITKVGIFKNLAKLTEPLTNISEAFIIITKPSTKNIKFIKTP